MPDFTSALYLGLQHPSRSLRPWHQLTTGAPAALVEPAEAREIGRSLAELQGCEAATLATSTLHLAWDLFDLLAQTPITLFMDAGAYPISRWGAQRAAMRGALVQTFPHHDAAALGRALSAAPRGRVPVIVTDGFCPSCGRVAPLADYLALAQRRGGMLVADDTQALGILGQTPSVRMPYGQGGGGSLRWSGLHAPEALVFSSLAKGFGVPIAVLAGSRAWIRRYEEKSLTRVHCSPPSVATLRAAEHAVEMNRTWGDILRHRLALLVRRFREGLRALGLSASGGLFPIQTLVLPPRVDAEYLHRDLENRGLRTVLRAGRKHAPPQLTFLLTAAQSQSAVQRAVETIDHALATRKRNPWTAINSRQEPHSTANRRSTIL
ncbi:MAG: aminotransferase class I/II-fold pyridoxal phosphate-dependent enzyme [Terrimicrobiaceae bacterium]